MSTADGWDLTVPEDAAELLAELRRHGVKPGQRLHVVQATEQVSDKTEKTPERPRRSFDFAASFTAESDLSACTDEYLQRGFGRE
jgi:MFS superfamily sulfate permease-like transporter